MEFASESLFLGHRGVAAHGNKPSGPLRYDAEDPEGHLRSFAQRVREVSPEDLGVQRA